MTDQERKRKKRPRDANQLAGIEHEILGRKLGASLRALNPGLARGVLHAPAGEGLPARVDPDGIYLLPESTADLPRVAGILTRGEGSSLSHVQLLARNLGIPNVVVGEAALPQIRALDGTRCVLAVSPAGVVQIARDGPGWDAVFGTQRARDGVVIRPDLAKLDLSAYPNVDAWLSQPGSNFVRTVVKSGRVVHQSHERLS